jgi:hypothetical protein
MNKLRSVNTKFWTDPFIEDLEPESKLLYLYLLTNDKTNMLGIYEVSIKKICYDTGLKKEKVLKAFEGFQRVSKVFYYENFVIMMNFLKNQKLNPNMKKSALREFDELPNSLKDRINCNGSEGFERLSKGLVMLSKIESEIESEIEDEIEIESEGEEEQPKPPKPKIEFIELGEFENIKIEKDNFENLKESYSANEIDWMIKKLGAWLVGKKKTVKSYKSLKAYFVSWVYRSYEEEKQKQSQNKDKYKGYNDAMETLNVFLGIDETENQTEPATEDTDYTTL